MKWVAIILFALIGCKEKSAVTATVYSMATKIPMPDYYRRITGYDSIQLLVDSGVITANFCYPNQWEFEKWKLDDTIKKLDHIIITDYGRDAGPIINTANKYRLIYCDTMGHILRVHPSAYYPTKGETIVLNDILYEVLSTDYIKYSNADGLTEVVIYLARI